ncbi:hypothetical protein ACP4OV_031216 [Aristida adscensionis]
MEGRDDDRRGGGGGGAGAVSTPGMNLKNLVSREYYGHKKKVHSVAWNCLGTKLASGSIDHTARVWSIDHHGHSKVKEVELRGHTDSVDQLCWDPKHPDTVATAAADKSIRLWDARSGKCQVVELSGENINITYKPDGTEIAVGNKEDELTIVDVKMLKASQKHKFNYEINEIAWKKTGELFFITTGQGHVEVIKYPNFKESCKLGAHTAGCYCIAMDPLDSRYGYKRPFGMVLALASLKQLLRLLGAILEKPEACQRGPSFYTSFWRLYFAVGSADSLVSLWNVKELLCIKTFTKLEWPVRTVSFNHTGEFIACASEDPFIDIANVQTGRSIHQIPCKAAMNSVEWNPKYNLLAYAGDDKNKYQADEGVFRIFGFETT